MRSGLKFMGIMKRILLMFSVLAVIAISCDRYDDGKPDRDIRKEFNVMYPEARDVEWDREGPYWVVSFEIDHVDYEAWYDDEGNWIRTVKDVTLKSVPSAILTYLEESVYGGSVPDDDVDYVMTPDGNFYRFELIYEGRKVLVDVTEGGMVSLAGYDY
ncbi:MAG: hypothetical protein E7117_08375 [Bacteroidales bacterium]|nr:hypothetical protein [Bacteroidales bacterium]